MKQEDFLRNIKDDIDWCVETDNLDHIHQTLKRVQKKLIAQIENPDAEPRCGLYLFDGTRQYGYSFDQLSHLVDEFFNPKSVFYKAKRGFPALVEWLFQVSGTSIGDLHGELLKKVEVTYHRPEDFEDEASAYEKYDAFWKKVAEMRT